MENILNNSLDKIFPDIEKIEANSKIREQLQADISKSDLTEEEIKLALSIVEVNEDINGIKIYYVGGHSEIIEDDDND